MNHYIYGPDGPKPDRTQEQPQPAASHTSPVAGSQWQYVRPQKKSSFKSYVATLLAGAVMMGGFMYAADYNNWFTGDQVIVQPSVDTVALNGSANAQTVSGTVNANNQLRAAALNGSGNIVRPNQIADIVAFASPAVVKIETTVKTTIRSNNLFNDPFFRYFFGDSGSDSPDQQQETPGGKGTGFIFEKSGYILTNQHVIEGADTIKVAVEGYEQPFTAKLLGSERELDLAVLKIENTKDFPVLPLGNSDDIRVGEWVIAIGNPYEFEHTVTVGVLSAKERPIDIPEQGGTRRYKHLLQTDASINPGNSGGPLLNLNGEVIGINTAVSAQAQGIGFAIPTSTISSVLDNLKNNISIPKPYIGVYMRTIDKSWVKELGLTNTNGVFISSVVTNGPADRAGLEPYDVILAVNGKAVKNPDELTNLIKDLKVGTKVNLSLVRSGQKTTAAVTIDDKNKSK
jgi:serine protease Do